MYEPNYTDYSLKQLRDCIENINRRKYPERYMLLKQEIALRTEKGETFSDPLLEELIPLSIPASLSFLIWWAFTWRFITGGLILYLILDRLSWANTILHVFSPETTSAIQIIISCLFILFTGPFIMMQVLAKRYPGYRIRIVRIQD